jgi:hypothetical protein
MPLMLDNIRAEFARFLADDPTARWRMDAALAHVVTIAYERGLDDGRRGHVEMAIQRLFAFDLVAHLHRQRDFSERTFGPGDRAKGVVDHIRKELIEIEADPKDLSEWIDVVLLALDGAWRQGYTPEQIACALEAKQTKNEGRQWPDWRTAEPGKAIEHVREETPA